MSEHSEQVALTVYLKTPSFNQFYSGKHWGKRKEMADKWHGVVEEVVDDFKIKSLTSFPVSITTKSYFKGNRKMDTSNCFTANKLIEDGLVKAGILPDDTIEYVSNHHVLTPEFGCGEDKVEVWITKS